jgi:60 kDa SS-A/Ro ribonucleoprotein
MRTNVAAKFTDKTHEGAPAVRANAEQALRRSVMTCMLWEDTFYEDGEEIGKRIADLCAQVSFETLASIAIEAREQQNLRHVPLLIVREALRRFKGRQGGDLIERVIQRPDELGELLSIYWAEKKDAPVPAQLKIGLARALKKFSEYQLGKWNKDAAVKLRDVLFLSHAKPKTEEQAALFKRIAENKLVTPDTWEVALSGGADKKTTFERLLAERKLGALALLRNLRNMLESGVSEDAIRAGLAAVNVERVLPFRFIAAAKYAPRLEDALEATMLKCLAEVPKLSGKTALLIDHSRSMGDRISGRSELTRFEAAAAVAMILRETAERVRIFAYSDWCAEVPPRRGFALTTALRDAGHFGGTMTGAAVNAVYQAFPECERMIVITDEQSHDRIPQPKGLGYIINVAAYKNGIGHGAWETINGWSEAVISYIQACEKPLDIRQVCG